MRTQYNGIAIAGTGSPVAISATPLWAWDMVITTTTNVATITGVNGAIMGQLAAGIPYQVPGISHREWGDEPQIDLSQYSITVEIGGTAYVAYSARRGV